MKCCIVEQKSGCDPDYQKAQIEKLSKGYFNEFMKDSIPNSEKTIKKEVNLDVLQEVPPFASAWDHNGAGGGIWTLDLVITNHLLYHWATPAYNNIFN